MRHTQLAYSLIELLVVVAIIAALAVSGMVAYDRYVIKAKTSEIMMAIEPYQRGVAQFISYNEVNPNNISGCRTRDDINLIPADTADSLSQYVQEITVSDACVITVVTVGGGLNGTTVITPLVSGILVDWSPQGFLVDQELWAQ